MQPLIALQASGLATKPESRNAALNSKILRELADRDDIIYSIRRTIRMAIGEMEWTITPNLESVKADLKRWETVLLVNLALPGMDLMFSPVGMSTQIYEKASGVLKSLLRDVIEKNEDPATSLRVRSFFTNVLAAHDALAQSHVPVVKQLFECPSPASTNTLRMLLDLHIDDLTLIDAGCIVKNATLDGRLGEIYHVPGEDIRRYKMPDRTIPAPPGVAFDWVSDGRTIAYFNAAELAYSSMNPQASLYGRSPLESLIEQMVGAAYGDAYLVSYFEASNVPFGVMDLGPNVSEGERRAAEKEWDNRFKSGQRIMFVANKEGVKGFLPVPPGQDKDASTIDKLTFWANRKCAAYGLSLNDIGFTEDLHRTTAETQADLTQSRGINSFALKVEAGLNREIVEGALWVRDNPRDPNSFGGYVVPCFPFRDVRFAFKMSNEDRSVEQSEHELSQVGKGAVSINELRRERDLPPIPGGDVHVVFDGAGGPIKVEDLPNLPKPQATGGPGGPQPGRPQPAEAPGAPGQQDVRKSLGGESPWASLDAFADDLRAKIAKMGG